MKIERKRMRTMFVTALMCVCSFGLLQGQTITLKSPSITLEKLFKEIRQQSGYEFLYNSEMLEAIEPLPVNVKKVTVKELLTSSLKGLPLSFKIMEDKTIIIRRKKGVEKTTEGERAQEENVQGTVYDELGHPMPGVSVLVQHTKQGTVTDDDGAFLLHRLEEGNDSLVFSFVGYETLTKAADRKNKMKVVLTGVVHEATSVTVSTGYQEINRDNYTGTAVTVSGEELKKVNPQSILQSLQVFDPSFKIAENNLAGSNPNSLPNINVRGSTALPSGSTSDIISRNNLSGTVNMPTFILDGYEVGVEKIFDLDINRVKSVTLLKDAAATAIYGSRAANGVVVITTNPPKAGKLNVSYNFELNVTTPDLTQYHVLNSTQKLAYEKMAGLYNPQSNPGLTANQMDDLYYHKLEQVLSGVETDWLSQPLHTAIGQKHSLYLEGGSSSFRYGIGLRYQTAPGVMKGSGRDRLSTDINFSYNVGKTLLFRNTLTVTKTNTRNSPYGNFSNYVRMNPYYPMADATGNILQVVDDWSTRQSSGSLVTTPVLNPLYNATLGGFDKSEYLELIDAFSADWTIRKGLRLRGLVSVNQTRSTGDRFISPFANEFYFYGTDELNKRGQYDYNNNIHTSVDGSLTLNYNRRIGRQFINLVIGGNIKSDKTDYKAFTAIGFTNDHFSDIGFSNGYAEGSTPYSSVDEQRLIGAFTSLNYSFADKYLMDFTFREDGSSKFGTENRVAPFSAFGLGWNMHKEAFMQSTGISRLKLRASTGLTGSVSFSPYMAQTTYNYYLNSWYATGAGAIVNNFGNDLLQWQKTRNYDLGLEFGLLNDRLLIMPRYYYKLTKGLIADVTLPPSTGFGSYKENIGDMKNMGWELGIQYNVVANKNFSLNLTANLVSNKNTIVRISDALKAYNNSSDSAAATSQGVPLLRYEEGRSLNTIYAVQSLGIDPENGREIYLKKDGTRTYEWSAKDIVPVGVDQPKVEGYFGSNIRYKQFNLNFNFYTRLGGDHYNQTLVDRVENANPRYNVDSRVFEDKWKQPGDLTFYKNIADLGQTQTSSRFVQKDNLLELQSLYLSYDAPKALFKQWGMESLRVALTMNQLFRISSIEQERGIDYPFARSFTLSLTTNF